MPRNGGSGARVAVKHTLLEADKKLGFRKVSEWIVIVDYLLGSSFDLNGMEMAQASQ
jgi:hypothetical protein